MSISVFISNLSEDVWPFIQTMGNHKTIAYEIAENANLSDRDQFAIDKNTLLITPKTVAHHSGQICLDIIKDQKIINQLIELKNINLIPYSTTPQFLQLVEFLRSKKVIVNTPESPLPQNAWMINFFGTKSGFRQFVQNHPKLLMPMGYITFGVDNAADIAVNLLSRTGGVVLKTDKGHCGAGVLIIKTPISREEILTKLKASVYWSKFPIIVEKYIQPNLEIGGGFPNAECYIDESGKARVLYLCGMKVSPEGVFAGIEIGSNVFSQAISQKITQIAKFISQQYALHGYRGYFEFDFIAGLDGKLYLSESNIRRTGGTHVYLTAKKYFGPNFIKRVYTLSENNKPLNQKYSFSQIQKKLKPILFNPKTKEGLIVVSKNLLSQKKLAYIIFAADSTRAHHLQSRIMSLLYGH